MRLFAWPIVPFQPFTHGTDDSRLAGDIDGLAKNSRGAQGAACFVLGSALVNISRTRLCARKKPTEVERSHRVRAPPVFEPGMEVLQTGPDSLSC